MIVNTGILIRVRPTAAQRRSLERHFDHTRFIWNHFLDKRRREYQESQLGSSYFRDCTELTKLKRQPDHEWLYESSVASQQRALKHLDDAYKRFFKGNARFPRFKAKRGKQTFTVSGGIKITDCRVVFPKFKEGLKFKRSIPKHSKINSITITKTRSGLYYVSLSVEASAKRLPRTGASIGLDLGLIDFCVLSNGKRIKNPRHLRLHEKALAGAQQHLSRKQKGSSRREKQRIQVARLHEKIANSRKDFLHKTSRYVVERFDTIAVEDLAVKNMLRNHSLAKHIADAGWGQFLRMLSYKSQWHGRHLIVVDRFYPSSKTCGKCGFIAQDLPLQTRTWTCPHCGSAHDRDQNAARNILREAQRISARQSPITDAEAA